MCRQYKIVSTHCGHHRMEGLTCHGLPCLQAQAGTPYTHTISTATICAQCLSHPTVPSTSQKSLLHPATSISLSHARLIWERSCALLFPPPSERHPQPAIIGRVNAADALWLQEAYSTLLSAMFTAAWIASQSKTQFTQKHWDKVILIQFQRVIERSLLLSQEEIFSSLEREFFSGVGKAKPLQLEKLEIQCLEEEEKECNICREEYDESGKGEQPRKLPCGHVFGGECISRAFQECAHACPTCRRVFKEGDFEAEKIVSEVWWMKVLRGEERRWRGR